MDENICWAPSLKFDLASSGSPTTFCVFYEDGNKTEFDGKLNVLGYGSDDFPLVAGC